MTGKGEIRKGDAGRGTRGREGAGITWRKYD